MVEKYDNLNMIGKEERKILKEIGKVLKRKDSARKGEYGRVAVIGGSKEYSGGIALTAQAVYFFGIDVVKLITIKDVKMIALSRYPWLIAHGYNVERLSYYLLHDVLDKLKKIDVMVIGPGLTTHIEALRLIKELLLDDKTPNKVVLDADALAVFNMFKDEVKNVGKVKEIVLTPHKGEASNYLLHTKRVTLDKLKKFSKEYKVTVLLKGKEDIVVKENKRWINKHGSPYMAKAATGDVLAGIVGAFLFHTNDGFLASKFASLIYGLGGERAKTFALNPEEILDRCYEIITHYK